MIEQRFALQYRQAAEDEPGLVLGEDGTVYVVGVDGSRTALNGGGGGKLDPFTTVTADSVVLNTAGDSLTIEGDGIVTLSGGVVLVSAAHAQIGKGSAIGVSVSVSLDDEAFVTVVGDTTGSLGFFGGGPQGQIPGAGLATVADVVGALQSYGLLG